MFDTIRKTAGLWFGVIDGARLGDIVTALSQTPLQNRPLYIDLENKPEQLKHAPFLIALNRADATAESLPDEDLIKHCFDVAKTSSACVFWHCNAGGDVLYHHLRSINKIVTPKIDGGVVFERETETALFRHADANVMAQILSAFNGAELSRLLGPVDFILARPDNAWGDGLVFAVRNPDMPEPHNGLLQISPQTYLDVKQQRRHRTKTNIARRLRKSLPQRYGRYDANQLRAIVDTYYQSGREIGLKTERGFYQWTYLMQASHDQFINQHMIREYLTGASQKSIDDRLDEIFAAMVLASQNGG